MNKYIYTIILGIGLTFSGLSFANHKTVCTSGDVERHIEVVTSNPETGAPCEVHYTKDGQANSLWNAKHDASFCKEKAQGLAQKLSDAGWNCETKAHDGSAKADMKKPAADAKSKTHKKYDKDKKSCDREKCDKKSCDCKDKAGKKGEEAPKKLDKKAERKAKKAARKAERAAKKAAKKAERAAEKTAEKTEEAAEEAKEEVTE